MAKRKEVIIGLHSVFTLNTDNLYDISTFSYEQSVDENTILFAIADSEDVGKYITINGEPKIISENDNFIITDGVVFSGNGGGSGSEDSTCNCGYRIVQTSSDLGSIDSCEVGTVVYVIDEDKFYKYDGTDFSVIDLGGTYMLPAEVYATISNEGGVPSLTSTYGFDDIKNPGVYFLGAGYNQSPGTLYVISTTSENDYVVQMYKNSVFPYYSFTRTYNNSSWSEWVRSCDSDGYGYTSGTNIDITNNVISAKGYVFNETTSSFAEGVSTTASGYASHAEGDTTTASGYASHAEGDTTTAIGDFSHTEGVSTTANELCSHAEGNSTTASGEASHAEGYGTVAKNSGEHAEGRYNVSNKSLVNNNGHAYIDLGLPSGLLWAAQNVGATSPEENGWYFDWGNIDGHPVDENGNVTDGYSFDETTYAITPGSVYTDSTLDSLHDAATHNMGGDWRMPTVDEIDELVQNTVHYYIGEDGSIVAGPFNYETNTENKGLDGSKLRSICFVKKDATFDYNVRGNFIEIPFAGSCIDSLLSNEGWNSFVFSSSVDDSNVSTVLGLHFDSFGYIICDSDNASKRYCGLSIRGVISKESIIYETISSIGIGTNETDRKNAFEVMHNGDIYIYGIGDYNGKHLDNVGSIQTAISNLQEGVEGVVDNQITYNGSNNININNGTITALGYDFDDISDTMEIDNVDVRGTLEVSEEFINYGGSVFKNNIAIRNTSNNTISVTINAQNGDITTIGKISANEVNAANGFYETSDIRKKNVIDELPLDKAYELINNCQSIIYTLKDNTDKQQIGLIAQEVKEFFPEIVEEDKDGYLSLDYSRLTVVLLRVLKDLIDRVSKLEK